MNPQIERLLPNLKTLLDQHVKATIETERRIQLAEIRRNHAYWQGNQYVVPVVYNQQVVDYRTASGDLKYPSDVADSAYDYSMNHIRGDGKTLISVLGQRAPNVKAIADNLDDDESTRAASKMNDLLAKLRALWDVEAVQRRLSKMVWLSGTTFGQVRWVSNGRKYGYLDVPNLQETMVPDGPPAFVCSQCGMRSPEMGQCPGCGKFLQPEELQPPQMVPSVQEAGPPTRYPKGAPELSLRSPLQVATVFYGTGVDTLPWIWCEREEHQAVVLATYNDGKHPEAMQRLWALRNKTASATASADVGQMARDSVSSPVPYAPPRPDRWLYGEFYLSPEMFMFMGDDADRELLFSTFPSGMRVTTVQDEPIDVTDVRLMDEWSVCFPEPPDNMYPDPLCKDFMGVQDIINDVLNVTVETAERAIPVTFYDPNVISKKYWKDNAPAPGTMTPAIPGVGSRLKEALATISTSDLKGDLLAWSEGLVTRGRELVGASPALSGTESAVQTAYQASRQLNQALMKLSPVWNEMRSFWEQTYMNGLKSLLANDPDLQGVTTEGWHLEVEEAIPMSWGQIRDFFALLLDKGPEAWQMFGLMDPANVAIVHTALGLQGWKLQVQEERQHILDTIRQLLKEAPIMAPVDPMTGQPMGPLQPSLPPNDLEFNPMLVVQVVREWMQGEEAAKERQAQPPSPGYANVEAWGRAYMMLTMPPPMPGPGGPPPEGGGPPPPGGEAPPQGARDMNQPPAPPPSVRGAPMPGPATPMPQGQ